jgi:hypothetical protein
MLQHSKVKKYAFVGTSSSGKTTATYQTCGFLKEHGIRVDGILQQDRRLPFSPALLETHAEAQYWFISNIIAAENYLTLQKGVDCVVSDRSAVDFFAYAKTQWPQGVEELRQFVLAWASTYETLYYLPPRAYDDDGVRPSDSFRLAVDMTLLEILKGLKNVVHVSEWKEAAREIAINTKAALLGEADAYITGSWSKGKERPGSDFDFFMLASDFIKIPEDVRATMKPWSSEAIASCKRKHNDVGLIGIYHSSIHNVDVQLQDTQENLLTRLSRNHE